MGAGGRRHRRHRRGEVLDIELLAHASEHGLLGSAIVRERRDRDPRRRRTTCRSKRTANWLRSAAVPMPARRRREACLFVDDSAEFLRADGRARAAGVRVCEVTVHGSGPAMAAGLASGDGRPF
jgi:hypothetical protein